MSDKTTEIQETSPEKAKAVQSVIDRVAEAIANCNPAVTEQYVQMRVDQKVAERVAVLDKAAQKHAALTDELEKASKPDIEEYDADDKPLPGKFSKQAREKRNAAQKKFNKFNGVFERALSLDPKKEKPEVIEAAWKKLKEQS